MYQQNVVTPGYGQPPKSQGYQPQLYGQQPQPYLPQPQPYPYAPNQTSQDPRYYQGYLSNTGPQPQPQYNQQYPVQPVVYRYDPPPVNTSTTFKFTEKSMRNAFVCKVYAILTAQMILTISIMLFFIFVPPVKAFVSRHWYLYVIAMVITLVLMLVLGCFTGPRRMFPLNYILLGVFTLAEGFLLGVISVNKDTIYVLYAGLITLSIVIAISLFALQTSIDFTYLSGAMLIVSIVFLGFGIIAFIVRSKILNLVYCCIGVIVFSMFLLVDTQLMLGGNHKYSISPEDYVFAALNLYVDIVQIFMMLLCIFTSD